MTAPHPSARDRAKKIVEFWRRRAWLSGSAPLHVHPLDLEKLEELITAELEDQMADVDSSSRLSI
jgi:hypothetical protein